MTNASAQTAPAPPGDATTADSRRLRCVARRRLLLLGCFLLLVAVGAAANYGPMRHYLDARARLERVAGQVAGLEEQKAALQAQLAKLSEAGHLEGLAREELTYARPDEELYIVAEPTSGPPLAADAGVGDEAAGATEQSRIPGAGIGAGVPGADFVTGCGVGAMAPGFERSESEKIDEAGLLERIVAAITRLF